MTIKILKGPNNVLFDVSAEALRITKILDEKPKTFMYGDPSCSETIQTELESLAQNQPGIFRLLWMTLAPWAEVSKLFAHYAATYGLRL